MTTNKRLTYKYTSESDNDSPTKNLDLSLPVAYKIGGIE